MHCPRDTYWEAFLGSNLRDRLHKAPDGNRRSLSAKVINRLEISLDGVEARLGCRWAIASAGGVRENGQRQNWYSRPDILSN